MNEDDTTKQDLIRDVQATARWRARREAETGDAERDARAADALSAAAADLAAMPAAEHRLEQLAQFYVEASDTAIVAFLDEQRRILSRYGYGEEQATTDHLLDALVTAAARCAEGSH